VADTYLLDNNVISVAARPGDGRHPRVIEHLRAAAEDYVVLPAMAVAEIEDGLARVDASGNPLPATAIAERERLRQFFNDYPVRIGFDEHAIEPYSLVRSRLWIDLATKNGRRWVEKLPEELCDRITGQTLGIDERDLIIVCTAIAYNLIFVTLDFNPGMQRIVSTVLTLQSEGKPVALTVENWST